MGGAFNRSGQIEQEDTDAMKGLLDTERIMRDSVPQAQHDEPDWGTSPKSLPFQWRRNLCEPLNMTNISLRQACGHQPGQIVQSILHLLCSDDSNAFTPWSCEGLNSLSSSCASLPLIPGRRSSSSPDCLPRPAGCTPLLLEQVSRQSLGCLAKPCTPRQHRAPSLGCPAVPGLNWKKMIGCGSFARVYLGDLHGRQVAVKVMSSRGCEAAFTGDLFESLVSANMHHPNVVDIFEVLIVQQPAATVASLSSFAKTSSSKMMGYNPEVRGGLGLDGTYKPATRAVSMPLPLQLSPFDTALSRAEDATGSDSAGREGSAAGRALITIKRHSSDAAAWPKAERCFRRSSCDGPGSYNPDAGSSWSGSSGGTDAGGPHSCGGAPSVTSPLPEPPQLPQSPRSAQVLLVMELADQRSLHSAISKGRLSGNMEAILLCAMDVAAGMAYLHSMGVIHADLKPGNVLLMSAPVTPADPRGFTCKIADFGMARLLATEDSHAETDKLGSLPYVAPEVLQRGEVARPADVYSYAVLLLELWCGSAAYAGENNHGVLYSAFCGRRPCIPDDMPAAYRELLEACWAADSEQRPSFQAAHAHLASMLAAARSR